MWWLFGAWGRDSGSLIRIYAWCGGQFCCQLGIFCFILRKIWGRGECGFLVLTSRVISFFFIASLFARSAGNYSLIRALCLWVCCSFFFSCRLILARCEERWRCFMERGSLDLDLRIHVNLISNYVYHFLLHILLMDECMLFLFLLSYFYINFSLIF
jgi:hypothetical protein